MINEYIKAIKKMIKMNGLKETDIANHAALDSGLITLEQFIAASRVLAAEILKR